MHEAFFIIYVIDEKGCIRVAQIHAIEDHVSLRAWQVIHLKLNPLVVLCLNLDRQVLSLNFQCRFVIRPDLLLQHSIDYTCLPSGLPSYNN